MARICESCNEERMFTLTKGDRIICVDCHNKEILSPQTEQAEASSLSAGLVSINDLIDTVRHLQYEAQEKGARLGSDFQTGKDYAYGDCAERLTEIVKAL